MTSFTGHIRTARPADEVFDYVADFTNAVEWDPGTRRVQATGPMPPRQGSSFELLAAFLGREIPLTYTIVEYLRPQRVVLDLDGPRVSGKDTISIGAAAGGTVVRYDAVLDLKNLRFLGPFLNLAFRPVAKAALDGLASALDGEVTQA